MFYSYLPFSSRHWLVSCQLMQPQGALVYVGILMASSLIRVHWDDLTEATPAFITAAMMPFTYSITEGIAFGFISYCVMKVGQVESKK